ncbi:MAG: deoxyribodipyrimidine photo-lyase [Deltaproteobacteria bacterium]|nr:deoxyribodipyrimidine photo-lyase [Deltaproteobacteria bacterium]
MQQSQRAEWNHALQYAVEHADERGRPLVVAFGLIADYPGANRRHYDFMVRGLVETRETLRARGIRMVIASGSPDEVALKLGERAAMIVCDRGYTRIQRAWRARVAERAQCPVVQVESDIVVPVDCASVKREFGAYTIRPKIHRAMDEYLVECVSRVPRRSSLDLSFDIDEFAESADGILNELRCDRSVELVAGIVSGPKASWERLERFLEHGLMEYDERRNDPNADGQSGLSPYLHFGQISPLRVAMEVRRGGGAGAAALFEELVVRRELAINFTEHCVDYDRIACLPEWARRTLADHTNDERDFVYDAEEFESARTHDPYWNAAQLEMIHTGKMHGYMRMYWGKKILEWSRDPASAFETAVRLNDKYELDGRDPNGYAGIAWCFGLHDRPWAERSVFGKVRCMNDKGLRRKFDADAYVRKIEALVARQSTSSSPSR